MNAHSTDLPLEKQKEEIRSQAQILEKFHLKFKDKNVLIYFIPDPRRDFIYQKYWQKHYLPKPIINVEDELEEIFKKNPKIKIVHFEKELMENRDKKQLFYKEDSHLTRDGALIFYDKILICIEYLIAKR